MLASLRNRFILIGVLIAASLFALFPRTRTTRVVVPGVGVRDSVITEVPLKRGLDLQGGMHLALELDQSKQVSSDVSRDIELALTVLRKRLDEFGVTEPLIQQQGDERIVVELAGITDPERAKELVQSSAFLEFRITNETNALEKALPAMDRALRGLGIRSTAPGQPKPSAVQDLLGGGTDSSRAADSAAARGDSGGKSGPDSSAVDTTPVAGGVLSGLIEPSGGLPGEYVVRESAYPRVDSLLNLAEVKRALPRAVALRWAGQPVSVGVESVRYLYALEDRAIVTGSSLVDAQAQLDPLTNAPMVNFELDRAGGRKFSEETGRHIRDFMAIILDGEVQGRPPVIEDRMLAHGDVTH